MRRRAACLLVLAASALPAAAVEPAAPGEELLEYLGTWNGDEDWFLSDEVIAASVKSPRRDAGSGGKSEQREAPAPARERTEQGS